MLDKDGNWNVFKELAEKLYNRELTGHNARDAINCDEFQRQQNNGMVHRRILIKDLRCGVLEKNCELRKKEQVWQVHGAPSLLAHLS